MAIRPPELTVSVRTRDIREIQNCCVQLRALIQKNARLIKDEKIGMHFLNRQIERRCIAILQTDLFDARPGVGGEPL